MAAELTLVISVTIKALPYSAPTLSIDPELRLHISSHSAVRQYARCIDGQ